MRAIRKNRYTYLGFSITVYVFLLMALQCNLSAVTISFLEHWARLWSKIKEGDLEVLDPEKEMRILVDTEEILKETNSLFLSNWYLLESVTSYDRVALWMYYVKFKNDRIKDKLFEMFKITYQCELRKCIEQMKKSEKRKDFFDDKTESSLKLRETFLNKLISKEGDLCADCRYCSYKSINVYDFCQKLDEEFIGLCKELYCFNPTLLNRLWVACTFEPGMYDYLWLQFDGIREAIDSFWMDYDLVNFATVNAERFLVDLKDNVSLEKLNNQDNENIFLVTIPHYLCKSDYEKLSLMRALLTVKYMLKLNREFAENNKLMIIESLLRYVKDFMKERERFAIEWNWQKCKGGYYLMQEFNDKDLTYRELLLEVYETLGKRDDIVIIKSLSENIPEFPIWDEEDKYALSLRDSYLKRVNNFRERVDLLIAKINNY